jgi:hypothetical protein
VEATTRTGAAYVGAVAVGLAAGVRWVRPLHVGLDGSPFVGRWRWPVGPALALPVAVAAAVVAWGPTLAARLRWRLVPPVAGVAATAWGVALSATDGWSRLTAPLLSRHEYERFAATIHDPGRFVRTFAAALDGYPVHVRAHPPLATLVPWGLDQIGLGGAGWFAALLVGCWGLAIGAALVAVRATAGEDVARRAAPALVVLPAAVWAVTSSDAMFAGAVALGVAVAVLGRRWHALVGGAVLGTGLLLTYGAAPLLLVPLAIHAHRRRWVHVLLVGAGAAVVLVATWALTGFWWLDGLGATRATYWDGVASRRPGLYLTVLGNPTALAVIVGPAAVAGLVVLVRARGWGAALLPGAAALAVAAADASQLARGEVERIWLPFAVLIAAAALGDRRRWLVAQAAVGVAAQALLASPW